MSLIISGTAREKIHNPNAKTNFTILEKTAPQEYFQIPNRFAITNFGRPNRRFFRDTLNVREKDLQIKF